MILYIANIATAASGLSKSAIGTLIVGSYKASLDLVLYAEQAIR